MIRIKQLARAFQYSISWWHWLTASLTASLCPRSQIISQQRTVKLTQPCQQKAWRTEKLMLPRRLARPKRVNDIMENGTNERREPMVVFIGHSDSEKLSKDKSSELPKFTTLPFFGLHPEIRSSQRAKKTRKRWRFVSWRLWQIYMFQKTFWINFGLIRPYRVSQKFVPLI